MATDNQDRRAIGAVTGWQDLIRGGGSVTTPVLRDAGTPLTGVVLAPGTYTYQIPVAGASAVDVSLRASAVTGTVTPTIVPTFFDGVTAKTTATSFAALAAGVGQTVTLTGLRGERQVLLTITVPGGGSLTLDRAEYSAL